MRASSRHPRGGCRPEKQARRSRGEPAGTHPTICRPESKTWRVEWRAGCRGCRGSLFGQAGRGTHTQEKQSDRDLKRRHMVIDLALHADGGRGSRAITIQITPKAVIQEPRHAQKSGRPETLPFAPEDRVAVKRRAGQPREPGRCVESRMRTAGARGTDARPACFNATARIRQAASSTRSPEMQRQDARNAEKGHQTELAR